MSKTSKGVIEKVNRLVPDIITCPVVIGNIPDASDAVHKMLSRRQLPKLKTINQANTVLTEWANKRNNISIRS